MRRTLLTTPLVYAVYVGIPLLFLGLCHLISVAYVAQDPTRHTYNEGALYVPAAVLVISLLFGWFQRHRPQSWPTAGAFLAGVAAFFTAPYSMVLDLEGPLAYVSLLFLPVSAVCAGLGWLLGAAARHVLLQPPVPELADTPYQLIYPVRGTRGVRLRITPDELHVEEAVYTFSGASQSFSRRFQGPSHPIGGARQIAAVRLTGAEQLAVPRGFGKELANPGGAAVQFRAGFDWVLPVDHADEIAEILRRRHQRATQPERAGHLA